MTKKQKVLEGLNHCLPDGDELLCDTCPYHEKCFDTVSLPIALIEDIYAVLKEESNHGKICYEKVSVEEMKVKAR